MESGRPRPGRRGSGTVVGWPKVRRTSVRNEGAPPAFASEPETPGRLFDFSSTTATRVLAIVSSEGHTPFVGAWLRERVTAAIPAGFVARARDENCWNACAAALIGRAYVVSTDPMFLAAYRAICAELARRDSQAQPDVGLGREGDSATGGGGPDTLATFFHAFAADALVRTEGRCPRPLPETPMDDRSEELRRIVAGIRTNVALRARSGLLGVSSRATRRRRVGSTVAGSEPAIEQQMPVGAVGLLAVREELGDCQRCKLSKGRKNLVFGVGNPDAHLVFVGEGPGADEDEQGEPFVGKAGQLLTKMIEAMGYRREDVYICNVVKCRPPGNRNPEPDEIAACEPFLEKAARGDSAADDRHLGQVRRPVPVARRHADQPPARRLSQLRGDSVDADVSPGVSASRSQQEERSLG